MKSLKFVLIVALIGSFIACKKETASSDRYEEGYTRVIGVKGSDTSSTPFMEAREQTSGILLVEDDKLRAKLIAYSKGVYTIEMTNKENCQGILRWNYEGLTIDHWSPANDVLPPLGTTVFTLTGDAKPGKIMVKSESNCGNNSSTLVLNITTDILPITFTRCTTERVGSEMIVNFSTEEPNEVDWFFVMWSPNGSEDQEVVKKSIRSDGVTKKYIISYPAVKIASK